LALVTTEGDEVELVGLLEAFQARWHGSASSLHPTLRKRREGWAPGVFGWLWEGGTLVVLAVYIPPFARGCPVSGHALQIVSGHPLQFC
jgi:hypothetical protein